MANLIDAPSTPQFLATLASPVNSVTGDGTVYTAKWDTLSSGSGYNPSTGIFTAPMSGDYLFLIMPYMTNFNASHVTGICNLVSTFGILKISEFNPATGKNVSNNMILPVGAIPVPMNAGDTASVTIQISGSTKTVNFDILSTFSAVRIL